MRTDSLEQLETDSPETTTPNRVRAEQPPAVEQTKTRAPGQIHYGRQHARTAELYRKHREERERAEQLRASEAQAAPMSAQATPSKAVEQQATEPLRQEEQKEEAEHPGLKDLAQQAVSSVLTVAKHAYPFTRARQLAGDALSGVRRVAREVSARTSRSAKDE
jgi:FtsZ-interacting cell division protein ZipA